MEKVIKKEHCPHCDEDLTMLNCDLQLSDVTKESLDGEPMDGTYMIGVITCPKCNKQVVRYTWYRNMDGYDEIERIMKS